VGIFTRLNPKTKEAYVKLRDVVKKGDVIAHIRVLGHLQDVVVDEEGKIKEILVEEGQPVEYGQPLFRLEA
jgi:acetyl-CoA carboxylase biotin carboxyl carrier protein